MSPLLILLLLSAPQNVDYVFGIDDQASVIDWSVDTSAGAVNESPDTFRLAGTITMQVDSDTGNVTLGVMSDAYWLTIPDHLSGVIPNPIPFLPPLATFDIRGMEGRLSSTTFTVDAMGNFSTDVVMLVTAGTNTLGGLFGSGTEPLAGMVSDPTPIVGTLTVSGTQLHLFVDLDLTIVDDLNGVTVTTTLRGPIHAYAEIAEADAFVLEGPAPLVPGQSATFSFRNATPMGAVYLAASLTGRGQTPISQLGVTSSLDSPLLAAPPTTADASGSGSWSLAVPPSLSGRSAWLQALEYGATTPIVVTYAP